MIDELTAFSRQTGIVLTGFRSLVRHDDGSGRRTVLAVRWDPETLSYVDVTRDA